MSNEVKEKNPAEPMTDREFHEKLNARAEEVSQQEADRRQMAAEAERVNRETRRAVLRRKATRRAVSRSVVTVLFCLGLWLAMGFDLMAAQLAIPLMAVALAWLTFWAGAWVQFMWPKGGLFCGNE